MARDLADEWPGMFYADDREHAVTAFGRLLCDLQRPASRALWREWLGAQNGLDPKSGIVFARVAPAHSKVGDYIVEDFNGNNRTVLAQTKITDHVEALAAAILTTLQPPATP
jgi:hypothetical protein